MRFNAVIAFEAADLEEAEIYVGEMTQAVSPPVGEEPARPEIIVALPEGPTSFVDLADKLRSVPKGSNTLHLVDE